MLNLVVLMKNTKGDITKGCLYCRRLIHEQCTEKLSMGKEGRKNIIDKFPF